MNSTLDRTTAWPRGRGRRVSLVALTLMYVGAGANHFVNPDFYVHIMPPFIPAPAFMVAASGVVEVGLGLALLPAATRRGAGWGIVLMLTVFFAVHVDMIVRHEAYPEVPLVGLILRIPLQFLLIYWAEWATRPEPGLREARTVVRAGPR
jgi:uncharacterized membrane protein